MTQNRAESGPRGRQRRGRPKGPNRATGQAHAFFVRVDELQLTLGQARERLAAANLDAPSYRTLQDWRRGLHRPRFVPFADWIKALRR